MAREIRRLIPLNMAEASTSTNPAKRGALALKQVFTWRQKEQLSQDPLTIPTLQPILSHTASLPTPQPPPSSPTIAVSNPNPLQAINNLFDQIDNIETNISPDINEPP